MKESPPTKKEVFNLDLILKELGFGRFQIQNFILTVIPIIFNAYFSLSYVFTAGITSHRCLIPECDSIEHNLTASEWIPFAIPLRYDGKPESCLRFVPIQIKENLECKPHSFNRSIIMPCTEIVFDSKGETIASDFNVTCDENKWMMSLIGTMNNVGQLISMIFIGILSDHYGRKSALILGMVMGGICGTIRAFSQNYMMFIVFEILDAIFSGALSSVAFVLGIECLQPKHRVAVGVTIGGVYPLGAMFMALLAYYFQNWRYLLLSLYIPAIFAISYIWLISESLRWLVAKSRYSEICKIIQSAAKMNKIELSNKTLEFLNREQIEDAIRDNIIKSEDVTKRENLFSIFKYKKMLFLVANCTFCILTNTFVYFGLSLNSVTLTGNKYLNFTLTSFIELPAHVAAWILLVKSGRRWAVSISLIFAGLSCIASELIPVDEVEWRFALYLFGKFSIATSFTIIYIYATEMFPTSIRNSLIGVCSMIGRLGAIFAPQMPLLASFYPSLPLFLFGGMSIIAGMLSLYFPETANTKLPDTIEEVLMLGKETKQKS